MTSRRTGLVYLLITAIGWGLNWPAMKILLREWPPLFSRGVAGLIAALLLALVAARSGERLRVPRESLRPLCVAASTNVFAWMGFSTLAMKQLPVSEAALLVYTMPIWAMLLAWPIQSRRPSATGFLSLLLGLAGIVVLFGGHGIDFDSGKLIGIVYALLAAVLFAVGTVAARASIPVGPTALVAWQVGLGCAPMVVLGVLVEHPNAAALHLDGWAVLVYMVLVPMAACYLAWFATLRHLSAEVASIGILLVPVIGIVAAAVALGEPLGARQAGAMALTLTGVALALRGKRATT